jgi:hypothetical protein
VEGGRQTGRVRRQGAFGPRATRGRSPALDEVFPTGGCHRHHHQVHEGGWTLRLDPTDRTLTLIRPDRTQPARRDRPASRHRPLTPPELHSCLMAICAVEHPRLQVLRALRQQHKVDGVDDAVALL